MVNPIPNSINKLWGQWNIRGVILFSLSLQIFLVTFSPLRKRMHNVFLLFSIWLAYLIADVAANFCVGLIASNLNSSRKSIISTHGDLLAFWAPFLLVHLGGPDTITAFSLEDNQLWLRHMLGFIIQFISCAYVFLLTVPGNKLWIPTVLVFVAGMIKYIERTYALYLGSKYPGDASKLYNIPHEAANVSVIDKIPEEDGDVEKLSQVGVVLVAYRICFHSNKPINKTEWTLSNRISAQDALRVIDTVWNLHYEGCYTKLWALCRTSGCLSRFVAITCHFAAFGLFFSQDKHKQGFDAFDVRVTYALLLGAMALDTIALLMLLFSDRAIVYFHQHDVGGFFILKAFHELIKRQKWSKCKKKPYTKFTELSTWVPFRRWKGSISGFNMISYCRSRNKFFVPKDSFSYSRDIFIWLYKAENPFLLELWEFIFTELKRKYLKTAVGGLLAHCLKGEEESRREKLFLWSTRQFSGECIIVWHVATHLCYVLDRHYHADEREFSKLLSDYMMYFKLVSEYDKTAEKLEELMKMKFFISGVDEVEACEKLLIARHEPNRIPVWLFEACMLAKELGMISQVGIKWEFISQVWVLFLLDNMHLGLSIHLQYLSQGGELISRVLLLREMLETNSRAHSDSQISPSVFRKFMRPEPT